MLDWNIKISATVCPYQRDVEGHNRYVCYHDDGPDDTECNCNVCPLRVQ